MQAAQFAIGHCDDQEASAIHGCGLTDVAEWEEEWAKGLHYSVGRLSSTYGCPLGTMQCT